MTGGTVVVLGATGRNFAAGMSGGVAYVYDPEQRFEGLCNTAMVELQPVLSEANQTRRLPRGQWHSAERKDEPAADEVIIKQLLQAHLDHTASQRARELLDDWDTARGQFVKVMPYEYQRALREIDEAAKSADKASA